MQASCSARLLQPFLRIATTSDIHRDLVPAAFWQTHPDGRVSLLEAQTMLERGVERSRDEYLGLKLGTTMSLGTAGVFDYVVRSAPTMRDSFAVISRYSRLLTDSFRVTVEARRRQTLIRLDDESSWPRSAADFAMGSLYKLHVAEQIPASQVECWFAYSAPRDISFHARTFPGVSLKFGAPFFGFVFEAAGAEAPMPGADASLHMLLRARADAILTELTSSHSLASVVRRVLLEAIPTGDASVEAVARTLRMSRRTMTRRLERERTTFQAELDTARRQLALDHLRQGKAPLTEIAFLSGFSHVESFHRAFKRWTGQTPLAYRSACAEA